MSFTDPGVRFLLLRGILLLGPLILPAGAQSGTGAVTIVENGLPTAEIVLSANPTRYAQIAALELQTYVGKISGAQLSITSDAAPPAAGYLVLIGESELTRQLGYQNGDFEKDEFLVETRGNRLILMGRDSSELGAVTYEENGHWAGYWPYSVDPSKREIFKDRGSLFAVYELLEKFCGVRWYMVTEIGEVVPEAQSLCFTNLHVRRAPWCATRVFAPVQMPAPWYYQGSPLGERSIHTLGPGHQGWRKLFMWLERVRFGGVEYFNNHSLYSYAERFGNDHPEWFADGTPQFDTQLCYANTQVVQQTVHDVRDYFDGVYPDGRYPGVTNAYWIAAGGDFHAVVPSDNDNYEVCPNVVWSPDPDWMFFGGQGSDYIWQFVNNVAGQVALTHPGKYVAGLAYHQYTVPPTFPIEPNVAVMYCKSMSQYGDPRRKAFDRQHLPDWRARTSHLSTWEYYNFPRGDVFPHIAPHRIAEDIAYLRQLGLEGQFIELDSVNPAKEHLNLYCAMKLLDDAATDIDALLDEYYALFYGPAEAPMRQFFERIEQISTNEVMWQTVLAREGEHLGPVTSWEVMCPADTLTEFGEIMQDAYAAVGVLQPYLDRVRLMDYAIYSHMVRSFNAYWNSTGEVTGPELLTNGSFDAGLDGWSVSGGELLESDGVPTPGCIALNQGDPNASLVHYVAVAPGRTFRFQYSFRCPSALSTTQTFPRIEIRNGLGGAGDLVESHYIHNGLTNTTVSHLVPDGVHLACAADWQTHSVDVIAGPGAEQLSIRFEPGISIETRFDGFSLTEVLPPAPVAGPPNDDPDERVVNGEFRSNTSGWTVHLGNWVPDPGAISNGLVSLTNAAAYALQFVGVDAGKRYRLRYRFKTPVAGAGTVWAYPWVRCETNPDGTPVPSRYVYLAATNGPSSLYYLSDGNHVEGRTNWQTHVVDVLPGTGARTFRIQFTLGGDDSEFQFDSVSLKEVPDWPSRRFIGEEIVANGAFDTDTLGWEVGQGGWTGDDGAPDPGSVSLTNQAAYLLQFIPVEAGTWYRFSFRFTAPTAGPGVILAYPWVRFEDAPDGNPVLGEFEHAGIPRFADTYNLPDGDHLEATTTWQRHEVVLRSGPGATVLQARFAPGDSDAEVRFDDISMVRLFGKIPAPVIGSIRATEGGTDLELRWNSVGGVFYAVESTTHPTGGFSDLLTNGIAGSPPTNSLLLPGAGAPSAIHRIRAD